jgi:hypothetical protein
MGVTQFKSKECFKYLLNSQHKKKKEKLKIKKGKDLFSTINAYRNNRKKGSQKVNRGMSSFNE